MTKFFSLSLLALVVLWFTITNVLAGDIVVTTTTGTAHFDTAKWKVVPRGVSKPKVTPKVKDVEVVRAKEIQEYYPLTTESPLKNSLKLFGGVGPDSFDKANPNNVTQGFNFVYGLGYERQLSRRWSVEAVGLANKTGLLGVGLSF
jgi:hypothetical protein